MHSPPVRSACTFLHLVAYVGRALELKRSLSIKYFSEQKKFNPVICKIGLCKLCLSCCFEMPQNAFSGQSPLRLAGGLKEVEIGTPVAKICVR